MFIYDNINTHCKIFQIIVKTIEIDVNDCCPFSLTISVRKSKVCFSVMFCKGTTIKSVYICTNQYTQVCS